MFLLEFVVLTSDKSKKSAKSQNNLHFVAKIAKLQICK